MDGNKRHYKIYSNYLEHHGILGQKWGVRRFQNKDGTLTPEGKKRYYNADRVNGELSSSAVESFAKNGFTHIDKNKVNRKEAFFSVDKYEGTKYSTNNCVLTSASYVLNELGIKNEVVKNASPILGIAGRPHQYSELEKAFPGSETELIKMYSSAADLRKQMSEKYPEGACGVIGALNTKGFGHSISWKIENGSTIFADSQSPTKAMRQLKLERDKVYSVMSNMPDSLIDRLYNDYDAGAAVLRLDTIGGVNTKYSKNLIQPRS